MLDVQYKNPINPNDYASAFDLAMAIHRETEKLRGMFKIVFGLMMAQDDGEDALEAEITVAFWDQYVALDQKRVVEEKHYLPRA